MKKLLLTIVAFTSLVTGAFSQVSMNMETWVADPVGSLQDPQGWASFNSASVAGMAQTVFKETTAPYAGLISAKIVTGKTTAFVMVPNPFRPTHNFDTVGILGIGSLVGTQLQFGAPLASRPSMLSFASKYSPMAGDSAFVLCYMTHWNGASRDTIATGTYSTGATTTTYAVNTITLAYKAAFASVIPDTNIIFASSSVFRHTGPKMGSTFYVDDFAYSGWNSTNDIDGKTVSVSYYPNPAVAYVTFTSSVNAQTVQVMDITGKYIGNYAMNGNSVTVETANMSSGLYIYNVLDKDKRVINRGKFEVSK